MKHIFNYIAVALSLLLVSCNDNPIMESTLPTGFTTDAKTKYEVPSEPGMDFSIAFTVEDPFNCSIKSNQEWCKVVITWDNGIHARLEVDDNTTGKIRTANVTITSPKIKGDYVIEVKQLVTMFTIEGLNEELAPEGEQYPIYVASDCPWTLTSDVDWITFDVTSGEATVESGPVEVKVTVKPNEDGIIRNANVTLRSSSGKERIITQQVLQCEPWETVVRIGDPDMKFDESKFDVNYPLYPQMREWMTAGRGEGIPPLDSQMGEITKVFTPENTEAEIKAYLEESNKWSARRKILLKNGEYNITQSLRLYHYDVLIGESKEGVILHMSDKGQITLYNGHDAGVRNLTLKGAYSKDDPDPTKMEETIPALNTLRTIDLSSAYECYVDNVTIINSACHPIYITGHNNTVRDVEVDGAYNKGGGSQGYFFIDGHHQLVTGCKVTRIRHISFQNPTSKQNVFYKNDVTQEVSFHQNDGGDNLVEYNRITIPTTLNTAYCAIMGPWSIIHQVGGKNFIYRNKCLELNRDNNTPWSDDELYVGPWEVSPADLYTNFRVTEGYPKPAGGTLYPVILK